jgi:uncharacterized protein (DUF736 family)
MAYELRDGQGSLFPNKKLKENHPDYRGDVMIGDVLYEMSGWKKVSKSGMAFVSLSVKPKQARADSTDAPAAKSEPAVKPSVDMMDDDIPF